MKKLFIIICSLFVGIASADNVITSKEYVDTAGAALQPQIQAKNTNTVLTYPAAGTDAPGEKAIYDSSAAFGTQTDALVTAGQFNNALQVALDTEFVCVSRNDQGCLLYEIRAAKPINLLNPANIHRGTIDGTNGKIYPSSKRCYFDFIPVHSGDTVNITSKNGTPPVYGHIILYSEPLEEAFIKRVNGTQIIIGNNVGYKYIISQDSYIRGVWVQSENFTCDEIVDPMLEISPTPHEYVPYQIYLPQA